MNKLLSIESKLGFVNLPFAINFPNGSLEQNGTCEFMTEQCRKFCHDEYKSDLFEFNTYAFFKKFTTTEIYQELQKCKIEAPLVWFAESGDCPTLIETKILEVMKFLSNIGILQNGFTRNKSFWSQANEIKEVRIFLTVEDMNAVQELNKLGPVAYPLYGTEQVRLYIKNAIWLCGGGSLTGICGQGEVEIGDDMKHPESCINCCEVKIGCYA